ncbi:tripartite tricarboxylate transporter TctB family protein [Paraliobacillus salinarum]|uniref:tripartite tricarboxylate transporter TctB family protein n=1 Tax=Paraliobacillus salinarum TaxID=1158996 RepID=UPI0015F736F6|nr:tripartite tricarboxylate transporter TctB family protein [Paraliobacillus salinarum]
MAKVLKTHADSFVVILLGVCILYIVYFQTSLSEELKTGLDSPVLFPKLLAVLLIGLGLLQTIVRQKNIANNDSASVEDEEELDEGVEPNNKRLWIGIAILISFVSVIPILGFLIASFLTMLGLVYLFKKVEWYKAVIYSLTCSLIIWFAFETFLKISLPVGLFGI